MDLPGLQARLRDFAAQRDWEQFHTPKNLAMAVAGEAGELSAEFQWLTPEQSRTLTGEALNRVRLEAADVAMHLLRLADVMDFDLDEAILEKIKINETRYPIHLSKGNAKKYTELR